MAKITLQGNPISTAGTLPKVGNKAPDFSLTKTDLSDVSLADFGNKKKVLNIFPSLDTGICAASVRRFNAEVQNMTNTVVLCISDDLPFAHSRFCSTEGLENVISLSELHVRNFGEDYGVRIINGPLRGVLSRAIVVLDENNKVIYTEQVPEIGQEPDYKSAILAVQ